ncbi:hypothetical protein FRC08_001203 [Ceratobasidium sp. 394]|nr:hypothetical protein FRC08_001203 [Ceratobasidium sp. 394]KAG9088409.1 hypothetical protein FS749_002179 [Ceratobasidium sp. UAMH 11750]
MIRASVKKIRKTRSSTGTSLSKFTPEFLGRKRSILLDGDDASQNVVINKDLLKPHKALGAVPQAKTASQITMSDEEFAWWSNPFLRMLSGPLRVCVLTKRYAPVDHLIRLTATLLPATDTPISPSTPAYLTPTHLHHPRYATRPQGTGTYITCSRKAIPLLSGKGRHRGVFPGAEIPGLIEDQITAGLQARCAEEAELLAARIRSSPIQQGAPLGLAVRRLTATEYEVALKEGAISDSNISGVLVVPKADEDLEPAITQKSRFLLRGPRSSSPTSSLSTTKLPTPRIPIFFGINLFHDPSLRARLRKALDQALSAERTALQKARPHMSEIQAFADMPYEAKARDAYALCASRRTDTVPLVIALWRLRMWEGGDND